MDEVEKRPKVVGNVFASLVVLTTPAVISTDQKGEHVRTHRVDAEMPGIVIVVCNGDSTICSIMIVFPSSRQTPWCRSPRLLCRFAGVMT